MSGEQTDLVGDVLPLEFLERFRELELAAGHKPARLEAVCVRKIDGRCSVIVKVGRETKIALHRPTFAECAERCFK